MWLVIVLAEALQFFLMSNCNFAKYTIISLVNLCVPSEGTYLEQFGIITRETNIYFNCSLRLLVTCLQMAMTLNDMPVCKCICRSTNVLYLIRNLDHIKNIFQKIFSTYLFIINMLVIFKKTDFQEKTFNNKY